MKIGLFFGSFNPIHIGHLMIANYMLNFSDLNEIWLILSPHNPLKEKKSLLPDHHRLELARIAVENTKGIKVSDIEFKLAQPSYTINTLVVLKEKYPNHQFGLIMGADNLQSFSKWRNYQEILKISELYVYPRPDCSTSNLDFEYKLINAPQIEISSTLIRNMIKEKKDIQFFVPDKVKEYIELMNFYRV